MHHTIDMNHFQDMFSEGSLNALYYIDLSNGVFKYISSSIKTIFGYSQEEFYNKRDLIHKIVHPDSREYLAESYKKLLQGDVPPFYEYKVFDKEKKIKYINQRNTPVKDKDGNIIALKGLITDITLDRLRVKELKDNKTKLDEISKSSSDWIWEIDTSGVYTYVSNRVEDFLGYTAKELLGKTPFDLMTPQEKERVSDILKDHISNQKAFKDFENTNLHKNGRYVILQTNAFPVYDDKENFLGYRGADKDITDVKNLINNLNAAQELAQIGHWELDLKTNKLFWSDEVFRIFGLEVQEFDPTYEDFLQHLHPDDYQLVTDTYSLSLKDKKDYSITHKILTKEKKIKYVQEKCTHKYDNNGNIVKSIGTVQNITKQVKDEKELSIAASVFKHSNDGIIITDKENRIISANKAFEKLSGYQVEDLIGKNPKVLSSGWGDQEFYKKMWKEILKNDFWQNELWDRKKDGTIYATNMSIICVRDKHNLVQNYIAISRDITESKNREKTIYQLAYYDFLTKLPNRKLFKQKVESYIKSSHYSQKQFALLFLDLDNFKWVNDSLGHHSGDKVLIKVATMLKSLIDEDSIVSRLGGDEFVILVPFKDKLRITKLATSILESVVDPIYVDSKEINISWSIGISVYPKNATTYANLLKNADIAMYMAKENGKNNFRYFNQTMNEEAVERLNLDTKLRSAIKNEKFTLNYQPKYSCKDKEIKGVEALIRWHDDELGFIPPDKFIPIAEESGYIKEIGRWVIKQALSDLKELHKNGLPEITIAINISGKQLDDKEFYQNVQDIIKESGVQTKYIEFEITETAIMKNIDNAVILLKKIKELGITLSIDDFGTGYSSLSYLNKLPIDVIKIDREFIMALQSCDDSSSSIIKATIALSKALKLTTVAEGVETQEQKDILVEFGCTFIQGYLYCKPLDLQSLLKFTQKLL